MKGGYCMFYKIIASRGDSAYIEKLKSVKLVDEDRVFCEPYNGSCFFAQRQRRLYLLAGGVPASGA